MFTLSLIVPLAAAAPCAAPSTSAEVAAAFDEAEAKFADLDVDGFNAASDRAFAALPCVSDKIPRALAAEAHRFRGLRAMIDRDPGLARQAFAAARTVEPGYSFPTTLVADDNPIRTEYLALDPAAGILESIPEPAEGALTFDGRDTGNRRPTTYPTVAQYTDAAGAVVRTAYLMPGAQMIEYPVRTLPVDPVVDPVASGKKLNIPLLAGAGTLAVASGAMWTVAGLSHAKYWDEQDPITDPAELARVRSTTNTMMIGALGAAGAAVGLGVGSVVVSARW